MNFERFKGKAKGQGFVTYYDKNTREVLLDFIITLSDCCQFVNFMVLREGRKFCDYSLTLIEAFDKLWELKTMPYTQCQNYYEWSAVSGIEVADHCSWHRLYPVEELAVAV